MLQFFKDVWDPSMKIVVVFLLIVPIPFDVAWSQQDGVLNLWPTYAGLMMIVIVYIIALVNWLIQKNKEGSNHV